MEEERNETFVQWGRGKVEGRVARAGRSGEATGVKQKLAPFALDSFGRSPLWLRSAGARFSAVYVVTAGNLETWHCGADRRAVLARTLWSFSPPDTILLANEIVLPYNLVVASLHPPWSAPSVSPVPQARETRGVFVRRVVTARVFFPSA